MMTLLHCSRFTPFYQPIGGAAGQLHVWGKQRPRRAAAENGMARKLVQCAGDMPSAPTWNAIREPCLGHASFVSQGSRPDSEGHCGEGGAISAIGFGWVRLTSYIWQKQIQPLLPDRFLRGRCGCGRTGLHSLCWWWDVVHDNRQIAFLHQSHLITRQ